MLTAEFPPSDGDATLAGYSLRHEPQKTRRRIGYCPQFDAVRNTVYLWNHLSEPLATNSGPYDLNFDTDDFATYNVAMASGTAANSGGSIPTRYVASGQSFFIEGTVNGTATFNNSMRENGNNDGFFFLYSLVNLAGISFYFLCLASIFISIYFKI